MRVIIAGSRSLTDYSAVEAAVKISSFEITEVVSGTARGTQICTISLMGEEE